MNAAIPMRQLHCNLVLLLLAILGMTAGRGQDDVGGLGFPASVLDALSGEKTEKLAMALEYIETHGDDFPWRALSKSRKLGSTLGYGSRLVRKGSGRMAEKEAARSGLRECAEVLAQSDSPGHKAAAGFLYDLVVEMDPSGGLEAAFALEKLKIEDGVEIRWNRETRSEEELAMEKRVREMIASASGEGIYWFDFSSGSGRAGAGEAVGGLARNQSLIKGLLVQELSGSQFAGEASQMNATVVGRGSGAGMTVEFNQKVGSMMTDAIENLMGFLKSRHGELPDGVSVELSFEEQYIPKDGPSAGVACALLLESLLEGHDYSPGFAVTGALDRKGKVGGVGGIDGKIRGAVARKCELVAIPSENEAVIQDLLILEGPATLAKIQIVEIETFEQALKIAKDHGDRDPETKQAVENFREVQGVLNRPGGMSYLMNSKVQGKLREVLRAMPNHLSAKYLLLRGMRRDPTGLTLMGSVRAIDRNAAPLIHALREGDFDIDDPLAKDKFGQTMSSLKRLRPLLDERTRPCADAIIRFAGYIRTAILSPPRSPGARSELRRNISTSGKAVGEQYENLFNRPDVKKELMLDD